MSYQTISYFCQATYEKYVLILFQSSFIHFYFECKSILYNFVKSI